MTIKTRDRVTVWGASGGLCAFPECKIPLHQTSTGENRTVVLGELAHIVADSKDGPRGNSSLTDDMRNQAFNLILLCPTHHTLIDQDADRYSVETLFMYKATHETYVRERLSPHDLSTQAQDEIYSKIVDTAEKMIFSEWEHISAGLLLPMPIAHTNCIEIFRAFRNKVGRAFFNGRHENLEISLQRLSLALQELTIHLHCGEYMERYNEQLYFTPSSKKLLDYDPEAYRQLSDMDDLYVEKLYALTRESTKAANWVCAEVRSSINPFFRNAEGKILATESYGLGSYRSPHCYTHEEIIAIKGNIAINLKRFETLDETIYKSMRTY